MQSEDEYILKNEVLKYLGGRCYFAAKRL